MAFVLFLAVTPSGGHSSVRITTVPEFRTVSWIAELERGTGLPRPRAEAVNYDSDGLTFYFV